MIEKCELDAANILFRELDGRVINVDEQVKIELFESGNFVVYAIVKITGTRLDVNIFANKYFNFPIKKGIFSVSKLIFDEKCISHDIESLPNGDYEINTTEYTNSNLAICVSLSAELIFSSGISGYKMVETTRLFPLFRSSYIKQPVYGSRLVGAILEKTKLNIDSFNFFLKKLLVEVVDFDKIKGL